MIRQIHLRALHFSTSKVPGISRRRYPMKNQKPAPQPITALLKPGKSPIILSLARPTLLRST